MAIPSGILADKFGEKPVMIGGGVLAWSSVALFLTWETAPISMALLCLFFTGGGLFANQPNSLTLGNKIIPGCPGLVSTCLMGLAWIFAEGLAPFASGALASFFAVNGPAKALGVMSGLCLVGIAQLIRIEVSSEEPVPVLVRAS
jgi:MFS family permease